MGLLIDGEWADQGYNTEETEGKFIRADSTFRNRIQADGSSSHPPEKDRYHLYVSLACPWAHRTLIFRKLKKLEDLITVSIVDPLMLGKGWTFTEDEGCIPDTINNKNYLYEVYQLADSKFSGRVTVPVLWDKNESTIVNNESSEIIRMFNTEFEELGADPYDFYPEPLRNDIDEVNDYIYHNINNGVYKCGFASTQVAYDEAFQNLFDALSTMDERLENQLYLVDNQITEADWRFFTTLVRFDAVYVGHFKCNLKRISDYPNLSNYLENLYQAPGVSDTVNLKHIKNHYYSSHRFINPTGIVPKGPKLHFEPS